MVAKKVVKRGARGRSRVAPAPSRPEDLVQGNDDQELIQDGAVVQLVDGVAGLRPVAFDRMTPELRALGAEMIQNIGTQRRLATELDEMVGHARRHGMSWGSIGWCVGTSAQAAQQRWSE